MSRFGRNDGVFPIQKKAAVRAARFALDDNARWQGPDGFQGLRAAADI
jgi:hypothetical protein